MKYYYTGTVYFVDGYYYHFRRTSNVLPLEDNYYGSPKTNSDKWESTMFWRVIHSEYSNSEQLCKAECLLIGDKWKTDSLCLNETNNSVWICEKHSEETKKKMSKSKVGNQNARGNKGKKVGAHPKWRVEKNRTSHLGQIPWNKGKKTRPLTEEEKKRKSDANWDGITRWFKSSEGEIYKVDYPISQFCAKMNLTATNLSKVWREVPHYNSHKGWTKHFIGETK